MNSSINLSSSSGEGTIDGLPVIDMASQDVLVEMVEVNNPQEEEEDDQPHEYAELIQMQPLAEVLDQTDSYTIADYSIASSEQFQNDLVGEEEGTASGYEDNEQDALNEEEECEGEGGQEEEDEDDLEEMEESEQTVLSNNKDKERMINRLMSEDMTFSEITAMFGEDANSDDEEPMPTQESKVKQENHAVEFEHELKKQQSFHLKMKTKGGKRRKRKMASALMCLMGQANLRCAEGKHDEAINMCMEVIRQCPTAPDPYHLLGMIYEEKKMVKKSLQFILTAAFLSPNAEEWERLAELCLSKTNDPKMAIFCLGRAIKANPQNIDNHLLRGYLMENIGERKKAERGYCNALKYLGEDQGKEALILAKEIVKCHYKENNIPLAREAMETAFKKYPNQVTAEDVNLMLELLLQLKNYFRCLEILIAHCGVKLVKKNSIKFQEKPLNVQIKECDSCSVPDDLKIDLSSKLAVSLIYLGVEHIAMPLVTKLKMESVEEYGDLFLDISEAFMAVNKHKHAIPLLELLLKTPQYEEAAVWLQYAECLHAEKKLSQSIVAYQKVVELAPQHAEARLSLSSLLESQGSLEDAMKVLTQDGDTFPLDSQVLYKRCLMLEEQKLEDEFITAVKLLLKRHFVHIRNHNEAEIMLNNRKMAMQNLRDLRKSRNEPLDEIGPCFTGPDVSIEDQWTLFLKLCNLLYDKNRFIELQRITLTALGSKEFMKDKDRSKEIQFMALLACIYNNDSYFAFNFVREVIAKNSTSNNRSWNLLNLIISKADDFRHNRFLLRLTHKNPDTIALGILNGHNCLVAGTYKYALAEYTQAFRQDQNNPLIPLMLGLTYTHMACQKFSGKKHSLVVQACVFLNTYVELRGECQESFYNLGRAMHQLNLLPQAIHYYNEALKCPPICEDAGYDLSREIAFNLYLIYKNSGNQDLASMYIYKYIEV